MARVIVKLKTRISIQCISFGILMLMLAACDTFGSKEGGFLAEPGPILFVSHESGTSQLYSMQPDGSDMRQLTDDPNFEIGRAVWSPEGTKIVFEGPQEAPFYGPALYVVNADGTGRYRLTDTETPGVHLANGERPVWSPDSRRIAFWRVMIPEAVGLYETYVIDVDGTNEQRLTNTPRDAPNLHTQVSDWMPDDRLLGSAFDYSFRDSTGRLLENGKLVALSLEGEYEWTWGEDGDIVQAPVLSPDGSKIAFKVRIIPPEGGPVQEEVHVMDVNGTNQRQLTHSEHRYLWPIAWSPDSTRLLVQAGTPPGQGFEHILIVPLDGSGVVDITPCPQGALLYCYPTSWRR